MTDPQGATVRHVGSVVYPVPVPGFTHAVSVAGPGRFIFVSGVTARGPDGRIEGEGDLEAQTRRVYDNLTQILAEVGATMRDVVRVVTYLCDMEQYPQMQAVRREIWPERAPASTTVEVSRLFDAGQLIEVEVTAFVRETPSDGGT